MSGGLALRARLVALLAPLAALACDGGPSGAGTSVPPFEPRAVRDLRALDVGAIWFRLEVDGVTLVERVDVAGTETAVALDATRIGEGVRRVRVTFFFDPDGGTPRQLATGTQTLVVPAGAGRIELSGLFYEYTDTDADGAFDVHELAESQVDFDGDGLLPADDPDSDEDGTPDGDDELAYGDEDPFGLEPVARLSVRDDTSVSRTVRIVRIVGAGSETRRLDATGAEIASRRPAGWPSAGGFPSGASDWVAFELDGDEACPDWRIAIDASSLRASLSGQGLLYFRRDASGEGFVAGIDDAVVDDLDAFDHTGPLDGDGPWNDALRVILVPAGTVGFVELYTGGGFDGGVCQVNVSAR